MSAGLIDVSAVGARPYTRGEIGRLLTEARRNIERKGGGADWAVPIIDRDVARYAQEHARAIDLATFEVALLMRNRFMAYEVYDEWFAGTRVRRDQWRAFISNVPGSRRFRQVMFQRLVPNLREIGLLGARVRPRYAAAGLDRYFEGPAADRITDDELVGELDAVDDDAAGQLAVGLGEAVELCLAYHRPYSQIFTCWWI